MAFEYRPRCKGQTIDTNRCKAAVHDGGRSVSFHQCTRKPWRDGWCKQHHPDTEATRDKERRARWEMESRARRREAQINAARREALDAIKQIAAGHNDPRGLAVELLGKYEIDPCS